MDNRLRAFAQTRPGHVTLLLAGTLVWSLIWAWFDVVIVRMAFPPPLNAASDTEQYWLATWGFMFPLASMLAFREHAWLPILAVLGGAWEDILFYWIQLLPVPSGVALWFYGRAAVFLPLAVLGEVASHRLPVGHRVVALVGLLILAAIINLESAALVGAAIVAYLALVRLADGLKASAGSWAPPGRKLG